MHANSTNGLALERPAAVRGGPDVHGPAVHSIDEMMTAAVALGASDIHVDVGASTFKVRFRLDGRLVTAAEGPRHLLGAIVARIKILSGLDIAEKRRPQDGRFRSTVGGAAVDVRVSTLPVSGGEKTVLRLLNQSAGSFCLGELGMTGGQTGLLQRALRLPNGLVLVTGPTGSGKTTTLYAALNAVRSDERNVVTVEDPVEYRIEGINQSQVHAAIGYTFSQALRAILRQDPDVIMVGEIRDVETAQMAVRAAQTGHLVLSTLHTNDAPSAVGRLLDMGIEPFLVAATVRLVLAQRLVRKCCEHCERGAELDAAGARSEVGEVAHACPACMGTGYSGRTALFEVMPVTAGIPGLISRRASVHEIREAARAEGMMTLSEAACLQVDAGVTDAREASRETCSDDQ